MNGYLFQILVLTRSQPADSDAELPQMYTRSTSGIKYKLQFPNMATRIIIHPRRITRPFLGGEDMEVGFFVSTFSVYPCLSSFGNGQTPKSFLDTKEGCERQANYRRGSGKTAFLTSVVILFVARSFLGVTSLHVFFLTSGMRYYHQSCSR